MLARQLREQGFLITWLALAMLAPLVLSLADGDSESSHAIALAFLITLFSGTGLLVTFRGCPEASSRRGLFLLPASIFLLLPIFAAIPFYLSGHYLNFSGAYFEAVSGLTSTGASMIADPSELPRALLLWRGLLEWMGGALTILIALTILTYLNVGGMQVMNMSVPHAGTEGILEQMAMTARELLPIYAGLTGLCAIALGFSGEDMIDALTVSLSVVATGGFTIHAGGEVLSGNPVGENLVAFFLMLGAVNILIPWHWSRMRSDTIARDRELLYLWLFAGVGTLLLLATGFAEGDLAERLRTAMFGAVSSVTTSGFQPDGAHYVGTSAATIMIALLLIGGMAGSTSSGFKIMRIILLFRHARRELKFLAHRHDASSICYAGRVVSREDTEGVWLLFFSSILILSLSILGFAAMGYTLGDALGLSVSGFANAGPGAYALVSNFNGYEFMSAPAQSLYFLLMILGRLEAVFALAVISRHFWRV